MYTQRPYRARLDWGRHGAREAAARGDMLVIVDVLSFSSTVATAIHYGGLIYPCPPENDASELARQIGGVAAGKRPEKPGQGGFSLSPLSYHDMQPGTRVVLSSLNGAACSRYGPQVPYMVVGALLNASAVTAAVAYVLGRTDLAVTVIAAGERQPQTEDGSLRYALEDYLGAGAILSKLDSAHLSPEARVCAGAFAQARGEIEALIWDCGSGRELREKGYPDDVKHCARLDQYDRVPLMQTGFISGQPPEWFA